MLNKYISYPIYSRLWGDRKRFGLQPDITDSEWKIWIKKGYTDFYQNTQQKGIGDWVCKLAYPVISKIDFNQKKIFEIGPGLIRHLKYICSKPQIYTICDAEEKCLTMSQKILDNAEISNDTILLDSNCEINLPYTDGYYDIIIAFNILEHLYPLDEYLIEFLRILKVGGQLVGGVPCEGGLAWGMGRFFTTRRYVHKKYGINYDKIICWEHPNFADHIIERLNFYFEREYLKLHPFSMLSIDFNLVANFIYRKI